MTTTDSNANGRPKLGNGNRGGRPQSAKPPGGVPFTTLFERRRPDGHRYLTGRIGHSRIIVIDTNETSRGYRIWEAVIVPGPTAPETATEIAERLGDGAAELAETTTAGAR
jgi:hypothetical protein